MMVNARVRRSLITGSQAIVTHNSRNPQPVIGRFQQCPGKSGCLIAQRQQEFILVLKDRRPGSTVELRSDKGIAALAQRLRHL